MLTLFCKAEIPRLASIGVRLASTACGTHRNIGVVGQRSDHGVERFLADQLVLVRQHRLAVAGKVRGVGQRKQAVCGTKPRSVLDYQ